MSENRNFNQSDEPKKDISHQTSNQLSLEEEILQSLQKNETMLSKKKETGWNKFVTFLKLHYKKIFPLMILLAFVLYAWIGSAVLGDPNEIHWDAIGYYLPPSKEYPLGTTQMGLSWYVVLVNALKNSLRLGAISGLICVAIAVVIGVLGPLVGGIFDDILVLITNIFLVFPTIPFILLLGTWFNETTTAQIILVIALFNWPWAARSIRSQVLSLRERDFVKISKITGIGPLKQALFDIIPNMFSYIFLVFTILINVAILTEAGIAILGLGQSDLWTLGRMLDQDRKWHFNPGYYHLWVPTGLLLTSFLVVMYIFNANWQSVFNPRLREN